MPRASRTLGRWQVVIGGQATEVQVAYLSSSEARELACPRSPETPEVNGLSNPAGDFLTLRQAIDAGVIPWKLDAAKKRLQRRVGRVPHPRGKSGNADVYARADLAAWAHGGIDSGIPSKAGELAT